MVEIARVPVLNDNYVWLIHDEASGETAAIDPAVGQPVLDAAAARGWRITQIWNTHWHPDHIGGNAEIKAATGCKITAPAAEAGKIPTLERAVGEGDKVSLGGIEAEVFEVPAHTAGHIAYYLPTEKVVFVGDTLFAMGCGKLFEGTAEQMYGNMKRLEALPADTKVYCAHEYTLANARFAITVEPNNQDLQRRFAQVVAAREAGEATVPTDIGLERATNPFMRASSIAELAERRAAKDSFRG